MLPTGVLVAIYGPFALQLLLIGTQAPQEGKIRGEVRYELPTIRYRAIQVIWRVSYSLIVSHSQS